MSLAATIAAVGLAAAGILSGEPVEDRLISSVEGYSLEPEGGGLGDGSGPLDVSDLAQVLGWDSDDIPPELTRMDGYVQMFTSDDGMSVALVMGLDLSALDDDDTSDFLDGFEGSLGSHGADDATPLFPDESGALGDLTYYDVPLQGMTAQMTAFMAGDLGLLLALVDADDPDTVLQAMVRDQLALTPLTASRSNGTGDDEDSVAYQAGRAVGILTFVGALVGIPTYLTARSRRRRQAPIAGTAYPFYPPAAGYPQVPPTAPGYPPHAAAPAPLPPPPPSPPTAPTDPSGWSSPR